jgi:hypothetical protein
MFNLIGRVRVNLYSFIPMHRYNLNLTREHEFSPLGQRRNKIILPSFLYDIFFFFCDFLDSALC